MWQHVLRPALLPVVTIVFLDASGQEVPGTRLTGFETADKFLQRAQAVK